MYESIKFTKEQEEEDGKLAFLDILIIRRAGRSVYRKATHTNIYLISGIIALLKNVA